MDFINYAFVAAHILTDHTIFAARYLPELDWVQDVYSATEGGKQKMEAANTSFMFKEIAQAIPFDSKDTKIINGKRRIVEIWDSKEDTDILRKNIISKLDKMVTQINSAKGLEKLSDAGSIIYWNDNHETIVSNIEEIVKKLC